MAKKIFIIGAGGFIGGRLLEKFLQETSETIIGYTFSECNLLSTESINTSLSCAKGSDIVIVAASVTRLRENSFNSMIKNIQMAENLSSFLMKNTVSHVIFLSTVDVYGLGTEGVILTEDILPQPNDYYATSKLVSEYLLRRSLSIKGIPLTILRLSGVYGPGDEGKSTINALVRSALTNGVITLHGDGSNKRDFIYVDDIYKIVLEAIHNKADITVNIATGNSFSIKEIAEIIETVLDIDVMIEFSTPKVSSDNRIKHMIYNIQRFRDFFPNINFIHIKDGIKLYLTCVK